MIPEGQIQDVCNVWREGVVVKQCQYEQCRVQTIPPMLAVFLWHPHHQMLSRLHKFRSLVSDKSSGRILKHGALSDLCVYGLATAHMKVSPAQ